MAKDDKRTFKITAGQGQFLLQNSAVATIPDKLGEQKYDPVDRAIIQALIAALFTELKAYSPWAQDFEIGKNTKMFFGERDNWKQEKPDSSRWVMQDPYLSHTVTLSKDAVNGAAWLCFAAMVPREADRTTGQAATFTTPSEAADTIWPLLKALKKADSVADHLGLKKFESKKHGWADDPVQDVPVTEKPTPTTPDPAPETQDHKH